MSLIRELSSKKYYIVLGKVCMYQNLKLAQINITRKLSFSFFQHECSIPLSTTRVSCGYVSYVGGVIGFEKTGQINVV